MTPSAAIWPRSLILPPPVPTKIPVTPEPGTSRSFKSCIAPPVERKPCWMASPARYEQIEFIRLNGVRIAACAWNGYQAKGRGMVCVLSDLHNEVLRVVPFDFLPASDAPKLFMPWAGSREAVGGDGRGLRSDNQCRSSALCGRTGRRKPTSTPTTSRPGRRRRWLQSAEIESGDQSLKTEPPRRVSRSAFLKPVMTSPSS